jgi:predicted Rossmann fold nucleotide-binding protein DprA/Smf involved in DNA uptake
MRCIIAGSRSINHYVVLDHAIQESGWAEEISEVVSGGARGVDALGEEWAYKNHKHLMVFPADWDTYGRSAGIRRNKTMAGYADALIAVWDGKSKGTAHMVEEARRQGLKVFVYEG